MQSVSELSSYIEGNSLPYIESVFNIEAKSATLSPNQPFLQTGRTYHLPLSQSDVHILDSELKSRVWREVGNRSIYTGVGGSSGGSGVQWHPVTALVVAVQRHPGFRDPPQHLSWVIRAAVANLWSTEGWRPLN